MAHPFRARATSAVHWLSDCRACCHAEHRSHQGPSDPSDAHSVSLRISVRRRLHRRVGPCGEPARLDAHREAHADARHRIGARGRGAGHRRLLHGRAAEELGQDACDQSCGRQSVGVGAVRGGERRRATDRGRLPGRSRRKLPAPRSCRSPAGWAARSSTGTRSRSITDTPTRASGSRRRCRRPPTRPPSTSGPRTSCRSIR